MGNFLMTRSTEDEFKDYIKNKIYYEIIKTYQGGVEDEGRILQIYKDIHARNRSKPPNFSDILETVIGHNIGVFLDASDEYINYFHQNVSGDERMDMMEEMKETFEIEFDSEINNLEYFIEFVLHKHKLACIVEENDEIFIERGLIKLKFDRDIRFVANDCQNILLPDFTRGGCVGYRDFINYYNFHINNLEKENPDNVLLLRG